MTPKQVIDTAIEMLRVCAYWGEDGEVEAAISNFIRRNDGTP